MLQILTDTELKEMVGKRIRMVHMTDPKPIVKGTEGTIYHVGGGVINVNWDNGRTLGVIDGVDKYEVLTPNPIQ